MKMFSSGISILLFSVVSVFSDELFMSTPEILKNRNISYEEHKIVTEDGYIITTFRIPKKDRRGVVLLQHSLSLDSAIFLLSQKRSIAMEVYNAGFELWLPNFRGLPFSDKHTNPDITKTKYWNFSFHEIGYYDMSAILNHIMNTTGTKSIVISYSLGSTASLVYSTLRPEEAERNVKVFVDSATSAFMNHTRTPLKYLMGINYNIVRPIMEMFDMRAVFYDFGPQIKLAKQLALMLLPTDLIQSVSETFIEFLFGRTGVGFDPDEFPMVLSLSAQPYAFKITHHYGQLMESGRFCLYDYGVQENLKRYNTSAPPDYPLNAIRVPIYLVISDSDTMSDAWGSNKLYEKLPDVAKKYGKLNIQNINHADYLVGKTRFVYFEKILRFIKSID